ncbi:sensor histidine kinase [Agromyces rhizosphaerae]|uniref:sensor histidine kinase n=1 Tax=Agromyces rhizosphaerae TaxID=88374 RepID=UPI00249285CE|nr:histidine kinase [Agromyces rhizosphaerae]
MPASPAAVRSRITRRSLVIVGVIAASLAMSIGGYLATPPDERFDPSYATLHAIVPLVFAICAAIAWRLDVAPSAARLMAVFPLLWIPQTIYNVIAPLGWLWPVVRGVDLLWGVLAGVLVLIYPRGTFDDNTDRAIAYSAFAVSAVNFAAVLLLAVPDAVPCDCAPNAYSFLDAPTAFAIIDAGFRLFGGALVVVVAVRMLLRWMRGSVPARTIVFLMPVALLAWATTLAIQVVSYAVDTAFDEVAATISLIAIATIPVCFVAGIAHARNLRARVADLMRITRESADRTLWEESLARTLRDPSVRVYWWDDRDGAYTDAAGEPLDVGDGGGAGMLPITSPSGARLALIRHDLALTDNTRLLDGVSSALRLSVDNGRLRSQVEATLAQVRESRERLVRASLDTRRRIERDLHDGAQQRIVALGLQLRVLADRASAAGEGDLAARAEEAITESGVALRELRELAHGIHPSLLSAGGLALAVPELAGRCPVPTEIDVRVGRLPEVIESTVYFVLSESLANMAKHAKATRSWVSVEVVTMEADVDDGDPEADRADDAEAAVAQSEGEAVRLVVRDDGVGGVDPRGTGILGMADRVEAVGGTFALDSPAGGGTRICVDLPLGAVDPAGDVVAAVPMPEAEPAAAE